MVRFLHTADTHLGLPFARFDERARGRLRERRVEVIARIGEVVRAERCELVLVAGDVFDSNEVDDAVVREACMKLRALAVPVVILPGNHDAGGGPWSVYERRSFREETEREGATVRVAQGAEPLVLLDGRALVLPAPLARRHVAGDPTSWFEASTGRDLAPAAVRVGLAHGSVHGFGEETEAVNRIDPAVVDRAELDYLALGDWHGTKEVGSRAWYAGTPEPTGFKDNDSGNVLVVEIPEPGAPPVVARHRVARTRWVRHEARLTEAGDLDALEAWFEAIEDSTETLVRLELSGSLSLADADRLESLLRRAAERLIELRRRGPGIVPEPGEDELDAIAREGWLREAVDRLRARSTSGDGDGALDAKRALRLLHSFQVEAREA